jgi:hypothetical protein
MAFKKSQVVKALRIVFAELHVGWGLDADKQDRWVGAIKARVLAIIAAVKKAEGNPKPPKWVAQLPWRKGSLEGGAADDLEFGSGSDEEIVPGDKGGSLQRQLEALVAVPRQGQALVAVPDKSSFVFGWDSETLFGWRAPLTAPDDRELSLPVRVGKGAAPTDPITCEWRDGMVHKITDITVIKFQMDATSVPVGKGAEEPLWEGEKASNHHRLRLDQRTDRSLLLSLKEQSRQILQCKVENFGFLKDPKARAPAKDPTLAKAVAFMLPLCKSYANGDVASVALLKAAKAEAEKEYRMLQKKNKKVLKGAQGKIEVKTPGKIEVEAPAKRRRIVRKGNKDKVETEAQTEIPKVAEITEMQTTDIPKVAETPKVDESKIEIEAETPKVDKSKITEIIKTEIIKAEITEMQTTDIPKDPTETCFDLSLNGLF